MLAVRRRQMTDAYVTSRPRQIGYGSTRVAVGKCRRSVHVVGVVRPRLGGPRGTSVRHPHETLPAALVTHPRTAVLQTVPLDAVAASLDHPTLHLKLQGLVVVLRGQRCPG